MEWCHWDVERQGPKLVLRLKRDTGSNEPSDDFVMVFLTMIQDLSQQLRFLTEEILLIVDANLTLDQVFAALDRESAYQGPCRTVDQEVRAFLKTEWAHLTLFGDFSVTEMHACVYGWAKDSVAPEREISAWRRCQTEHGTAFGQLLANGFGDCGH